MVLYAAEHQSKASRLAQFKQHQKERPGTNLFVKNLHPAIQDEDLRKVFEVFGTIASVKVMKNAGGLSKEFGFVQFESQDAASKTLAEMQDKEIRGRKIFVGLFQPKEERTAVLKKQFEMKGARVMNPSMNIGHGAFDPRQMPQHAMMAGLMMPPFGRAPPMMPGMGMRPPPPFMGRMGPGMRVGRMAPPAMLPSRQNARQIHANHNDDKQALGEKLYPLVQRMEPKLAGKITGMLLEMEPTELLMLLDSPGDLLVSKINEAVEVLQAHS